MTAGGRCRGFALNNANYVSQLRDLMVRISAQLPARISTAPAEVSERQYAAAGKLFALHEQDIYDALNHLMRAETVPDPAAISS